MKTANYFIKIMTKVHHGHFIRQFISFNSNEKELEQYRILE